MNCPKCNCELDLEALDIQTGAVIDGDSQELTTKCPKCKADLYTFVKIDWSVNE